MNPRARRIAVMVASVPVDTRRSFSMGAVRGSVDARDAHALRDELGELRLRGRRRAEAEAEGGGVLHGLHDLRARRGRGSRDPTS